MTTFARPADRYSPLYFLASLGAGGTAVTFFLWLYFWIPHPGQSVPVFADIARALSTGSMLTKGMIFAAMAGIIVFAYLNIRLLIWNLRQLSAFKKTDSYAQLRASNAETQLLAMPLTIAMTINVGFILGMVFVPGLWTVVEYLFPIAIAAFTATGALALVQLGQFLGRVKTDGNFDWTANGSFAQMMPAFALSMVGVGLAAPGALSNVALTSGIGIMLATFFMMAALMVGVVALVLGIHSMLSHGTAVEAVPTILIVIPILTVLGILGMRVNHGLHVNFEDHGTAAQVLMFLTKTYSVQILFALFGIEMLRRVGYAKRFLFGAENSVGAYALVCPAVAFGVMTQFWINAGLVQSGLLTKFSIAYWIVTLVALAAQALAIWLVLHLNRRHFGKAEATPVPAE
ncbi:hypothetical protein BMG00_07800 [Thioclava marina]|uniref:Uncharacterized protein n=1 Tax=Thioclava marina TaxID=1915077 RepID=A0ABX3MQ40_9RHOB|nr:hypothetical protein [Thioclava marina]OOY13656.1 hypothetical protein BMG00_07800 [Thioclava marina]